jgi:hypothetical protein
MNHPYLLTIIVASLTLTACGIVPLWMSVTSTVGDIILTNKTGKSSSEHGLSALTGKDCRFIRIIDNKNLCMNKKEYEKYLISLNCEAYTWSILGRVSCKKDATQWPN